MSWQKGEIAILESRHKDTLTNKPIPTAGTTVTAKLTKGNGTPLELPMTRAVGDEEGPFRCAITLDALGEWSGDVIAVGDYPTKRPIERFVVSDT